MKRRLGADVRDQDGSQNESEQRVDVHGQLDWREMEASQEGEKAVETRDFVEEERERNEFGAGA